MKNQENSDLIDAVRKAVRWQVNPYKQVAYIGSVIIGVIYNPSGDDEWLSSSHKFQDYGNNAYFPKSETEAREHVVNDFAEFCEAAGLVPAKAGKDE